MKRNMAFAVTNLATFVMLCALVNCASTYALLPPWLCPDYLNCQHCPGEVIYKTDANGCPKCECKTTPIECPTLDCGTGLFGSCPQGYEEDSNGCPTCICRLINCPMIACDFDMCPNGFESSANGCLTCTCKKPDPSLCPSIPCPACSTSHDLEKDANGCVTKCECREECSMLKCWQDCSLPADQRKCSGSSCNYCNFLQPH